MNVFIYMIARNAILVVLVLVLLVAHHFRFYYAFSKCKIVIILSTAVAMFQNTANVMVTILLLRESAMVSLMQYFILNGVIFLTI